ncbi:hypothetical protein MLD38_000925 [Melastoma candidum]|uniref:Uncharacterized protein n=1 Tax=Melastoma candidum TaxID=119954 RepID=A0ACB9SD73_9MYRT|nr:hypothetical protein MLD38_000925 [Melastoma candidum]
MLLDTPDQIRVMEESVRMRNAAEPEELVRLVKQLEKKLHEEGTVELPPPLKWKITEDILEILKGLHATATTGEQRGTGEFNVPQFSGICTFLIYLHHFCITHEAARFQCQWYQSLISAAEGLQVLMKEQKGKNISESHF